METTKITLFANTAKEISFDMIYVEGGEFYMGATPEQCESYKPEPDEYVHKVFLHNYYIGKFQVTQDLWEAIMGSNPSFFKGNLRRRPVDQVSWNDCQKFIKMLNKITGMTFVLPTEAQWEYAARGGNKSHGYKYSGSNNIDAVAWYKNNSGDSTHTVGQMQPNELGIYDMCGNVWEWCSDWYDGNYYQNSPFINPQGPSSSPYYFRILRGGGWCNYANYCRVSNRNYYFPDYSNDYYGFRLVCNSLPLENIKITVYDNKD